MENTAEKNMAESGILPFDPIVLVQDVLKRWMIVVLAVVAVGVSTYIISDMRYEPVYQTNTTFVVSVRGSAASVYSNHRTFCKVLHQVCISNQSAHIASYIS